MFNEAHFNSDISGWDVSSVELMQVSCYSSQYFLYNIKHIIIKYFQIIFNTVFFLLILTYILYFITVRERFIDHMFSITIFLAGMYHLLQLCR